MEEALGKEKSLDEITKIDEETINLAIQKINQKILDNWQGPGSNIYIQEFVEDLPTRACKRVLDSYDKKGWTVTEDSSQKEGYSCKLS